MNQIYCFIIFIVVGIIISILFDIFRILRKVFKFIIEKNLKIFNINIDECKITINFKEEITDSILQEFHDVLF